MLALALEQVRVLIDAGGLGDVVFDSEGTDGIHSKAGVGLWSPETNRPNSSRFLQKVGNKRDRLSVSFD
jgi:hypothetical protein